jgi:hypothetical protein
MLLIFTFEKPRVKASLVSPGRNPVITLINAQLNGRTSHFITQFIPCVTNQPDLSILTIVNRKPPFVSDLVRTWELLVTDNIR